MLIPRWMSLSQMENNQVSRQFTWNMLPTLLTKHKDSLCFYLLFQKLKDLLLQSQTVNELFLVNTVLLLQEKKYGPALAESQKFTGVLFLFLF